MSVDLSPELQQRVNDCLANLSRLSEASASSLEPRVSSGKAQDKPPPGFREGRTGPPNPETDSLFDWFVWKLETARSEQAVLVAVLEAEIRYAKRVHRQPPRPTALAGHTDTTKERNRRIAEDYSGLSSDEVHVIESQGYGYCSAESVRRTRLFGKRDPESGHKLPDERDIKDRRLRKKRAQQLHDGGVGYREIARRFDVSHPTVMAWLGKLKKTDDENGEKAA